METSLFLFLDGDVPRRPSYWVYISHLIRFARVCSHVTDFNARKFYSQNFTAGLSISLSTKYLLKILSPTL